MTKEITAGHEKELTSNIQQRQLSVCQVHHIARFLFPLDTSSNYVHDSIADTTCGEHRVSRKRRRALDRLHTFDTLCSQVMESLKSDSEHEFLLLVNSL
jgi:hypothetical protein